MEQSSSMVVVRLYDYEAYSENLGRGAQAVQGDMALYRCGLLLLCEQGNHISWIALHLLRPSGNVILTLIDHLRSGCSLVAASLDQQSKLASWAAGEKVHPSQVIILPPAGRSTNVRFNLHKRSYLCTMINL